MCVCVCVILLFSVLLVARGVLYTTTSYRACLVFVHTDYKQNLNGGHPEAKKKREKEEGTWTECHVRWVGNGQATKPNKKGPLKGCVTGSLSGDVE